jgi:hypothetical protein
MSIFFANKSSQLTWVANEVIIIISSGGELFSEAAMSQMI